MKAASLKEIQTELENLSIKDLTSLCLRLGKFKKENKELLTYLLFESFDEQAYIENVKAEINLQMAAINLGSLYFVKKSSRKILRMISKYARYTDSLVAEIQWLIHFCGALKACPISIRDSQALLNLYTGQIKKIDKLLKGMHEDLQYDFIKQIKTLSLD